MTDSRPRPTVAVLHWGDVLEDYLDPLGLTLDDWLGELTGGWLFGYVQALQSAGVEPLLLVVSCEARRMSTARHAPTGAVVVVLPAPRAWRLLRRHRGSRRGAARAAGLVATPLLELARVLRRNDVRALLLQEHEHVRFDLCVVLARVLRMRVLATFQGGQPRGGRPGVVRRWAVRAADGLIVAGSKEAGRVRARYGLHPAQVASAPNPLELGGWHARDRAAARAQRGIAPEDRVVAWHGRVDIAHKGLDVLLEAWATVVAQRPDRPLLLSLTGDGPDAEEVRRLIGALPEGTVEWHDSYVLDREAMRRRLAVADVAVLASRREGFPVAPLEAMACGLPLVATSVSGIADIAPDGEDQGVAVVPPGDAAALAGALGRLVDDTALSQRLGARARAHVEAAFAPAAIGVRLRAVLLGEPGPG